MNLAELQNEINHLLFLYFTSIGAIQRDAGSPDISKSMDDLVSEIIQCKKRISAQLQGEEHEVQLPEDFDAVVDEGREFVEDGLYFIDEIVKHI